MAKAERSVSKQGHQQPPFHLMVRSLGRRRQLLKWSDHVYFGRLQISFTLVDTRLMYRLTYRLSVDQYVGRHIGWVLVNMLTKMCQLPYRPTYLSCISRYVDQHLTDMLVDISTESGCPTVGQRVNWQATDIPPILHCYLLISDRSLRRRHNLTCSYL